MLTWGVVLSCDALFRLIEGMNERTNEQMNELLYEFIKKSRLKGSKVKGVKVGRREKM